MSGEGEADVFDESVMDGYWLGRMEHDDPPDPAFYMTPAAGTPTHHNQKEGT
jgi:hypothetical protein